MTPEPAFRSSIAGSKLAASADAVMFMVHSPNGEDAEIFEHRPQPLQVGLQVGECLGRTPALDHVRCCLEAVDQRDQLDQGCRDRRDIHALSTISIHVGGGLRRIVRNPRS
jgi:hypothetical protein